MERPRLSTIVCALLFIFPLLVISTPVSAELSGNIAFNTEGLSMSPSTAVEGGEVTFTLSLQNVANVIAEDVEVEFHKNNFQMGNPAALFYVDVGANSAEDVNFVWSNLAWGDGEQTLVIRVIHDDDPKIVSHDFDVDGLANLRLSHFELSPATGVFEGEVFDIEIQVENSGNADAPSSHLELTVAGTPLSLLPVPPLVAGGTVWMNETINAPAAGTYDAIGVVNADSGDNIVESTTADNSESRSFTVDSLPDYRHADGPTVVADIGLAGPWTVSGTIARDGGEGTTTAPLELRIQNGIVIEILTLSFTDSDSFAEYSTVITSEDLTDTNPGDVYIDLEIDSTANLAQSNPFNNLESVVLTIYPEPNVIVTSVSKPDDTEPGTLVEFTVTLQNVGMIPVSGQLSATFDGEPLTPKSLTIPPINGGNQGYRTQIFSVTAEGLSRDIPFVATWTPDLGSYDLLDSDNVGTNNVTLNSELTLDFLINTEGWSMGPPLYAGNTYVYSIDVFAQVGVGQETFRCSDQKTGITFDENIVLQFDQDSNKQQTIRCSVKVVTPGEIVLLIEAEGTSISQAHMNDWFVEPAKGEDDGSGSAGTSSIILFTFAGLLAIAVLIGAIVLTRRGLADAERETYDICPACEGDIEGDEDICPHCDFDLRVGRAKFHDCLDCNSTIPSMLEHCPYCGSEQDIGSQYERRERKFKPLPEDVEDVPEVGYEDEDEIVRGHEGFDTHAGDLGFDEEQWEGEWDENLTEAETYFDTKEDERIAAEASASGDAETADVVTSTELSEVMDEMPEHDLDAFLGDVKSRRHITDADVELTASDADYREQIFELTGEDGVLPGQQVNVDSMVDNTVVGNEVRSASSDFTIGDEDEPVTKVDPEPEKTDEKSTSKRRGVRRRKKDE
jgi:RNA polymerase subunit RPABC4/transcription elongation factor Spt4